jgi:hypothetical protein
MIWTRVFERPETMHHSRGNYELLRRLSSRAGRIEGDKSSTTMFVVVFHIYKLERPVIVMAVMLSCMHFEEAEPTHKCSSSFISQQYHGTLFPNKSLVFKRGLHVIQ